MESQEKTEDILNHLDCENQKRAEQKYTSENRRFILDWTDQCKSRITLVAKFTCLQTATVAHISGPI